MREHTRGRKMAILVPFLYVLNGWSLPRVWMLFFRLIWVSPSVLLQPIYRISGLWTGTPSFSKTFSELQLSVAHDNMESCDHIGVDTMKGVRV